jgi:hypothetical protein
MLRTGDRILLSAFAAIFAGAVGGWALLTFLPAKAAPQPIVKTSALTQHAASEVTYTRPPEPARPDAAPPPAPRSAAKAAPDAPDPAPRAPSAAQPEDKPGDGEYRLKLEDGGDVSFDPGQGHIRFRTPYGNLDLKL